MEQKLVVANIDINGKLVDKSTDKGKNILKKHIGDIFNNNCEKIAQNHGSRAREHASEMFKTVG